MERDSKSTAESRRRVQPPKPTTEERQAIIKRSRQNRNDTFGSFGRRRPRNPQE